MRKEETYKTTYSTTNRVRRQSGFPTFIPCQRQDANVLPKRRQSHQGDKLCDVSTVPLVARWPVFLARRSDADGEPHITYSTTIYCYTTTTIPLLLLLYNTTNIRYATTIGRWTAIAQVTSMRGTCGVSQTMLTMFFVSWAPNLLWQLLWPHWLHGYLDTNSNLLEEHWNIREMSMIYFMSPVFFFHVLFCFVLFFAERWDGFASEQSWRCFVLRWPVSLCHDLDHRGTDNAFQAKWA